MALIGVLEPFEEGARRVLPRLSGLNVSGSRVQRTTEAIGEDVARRRAAGETFGPTTVWDWNRDASGRSVAYVSLDATGVLQQGPHAEKAEGRMPWVGAVFNPQPTHETKRSRRVWEACYVSGLMSLEQIGRQMRQECLAVGVGGAEVVIGLTDGGNGLEDCLIDALGGIAKEVEFILDFYHVSEHLLEFAKVFLPQQEPRRRQVEQWCCTLKHQGGQALYEQLQSLDLSAASAAGVEAHHSLLGYFGRNLHRMDYPRYIARGWQIGSGVIESACKAVVCQRMKSRGMRWRERGTTALCQLRALYKSQPEFWTSYWQRISCA